MTFFSPTPTKSFFTKYNWNFVLAIVHNRICSEEDINGCVYWLEFVMLVP